VRSEKKLCQAVESSLFASVKFAVRFQEMIHGQANEFRVTDPQPGLLFAFSRLALESGDLILAQSHRPIYQRSFHWMTHTLHHIAPQRNLKF
jgi:hypothetical protein